MIQERDTGVDLLSNLAHHLPTTPLIFLAQLAYKEKEEKTFSIGCQLGMKKKGEPTIRRLQTTCVVVVIYYYIIMQPSLQSEQ